MTRRKVRVRVDPTRCTAFGFCAEFFPEAFALDDWGYAWLQRRELPPEQLALARETARLCPTGAITVVLVEDDEPSPAREQARERPAMRGRSDERE